MDIFKGENPDPDFPQNIPFLSDTIGLAGVVDEPGDVTSFRGVYDLFTAQLHQICTNIFTILNHLLSTVLASNIKNLSDILDYIGALRNKFRGRQTPSLRTRFKGIDRSVLV